MIVPGTFEVIMFSVPDGYLQSEEVDDADLIDLPPEVLAAIDQVSIMWGWEEVFVFQSVISWSGLTGSENTCADKLTIFVFIYRVQQRFGYTLDDQFKHLFQTS